VGVGELPYLAAVAGTSIAALTLVAFGLLRRRGSMAWEMGPSSGGRGGDGPIDTQVADPAIARRIAELVPPPSYPDPFASAGEDPAPTGDPGADLRALYAEPDDQLLSDGSDEPVDDPEASLVPESRTEAVVWADTTAAPPPHGAAGQPATVWPAADPGVMSPLVDAVEPPGTPPAAEPDTLSRILVDPATGLGTAVAWELWLADEDPRERRYRRPTTIVLAELDGLDAFVAVHGPGVADRAAAMIGTAFRANVRTSDRAAVLGPGLFAVLLTETDEIRAVNFVERVRGTCEDWLAVNAPGVGIAFGWASPEGDGVAGARLRAQERLIRERR
jgi:GGDEF domain-containing protein